MKQNKAILIETFFTLFANAPVEASMDTIMMGIEGMMSGNYVPWAKVEDIKDSLHEDDLALIVDKLEELGNVRDWFEYQVNTVAMGKKPEAFKQLCELCMDFSVHPVTIEEGPF